MKKDPTDKELRDRGYLTPDEFVERLVPGLKQYLERSWTAGLCHPEELASNTLSYLEVAYYVISDFGIGPIRKPNQKTIEALMQARDNK